jgi:uncharacterized protein
MTHSKTFSSPLSQLDEARRTVAAARCWIITDGKAGDEAQCLGVAERLGLVTEMRRVKPRAAYAFAMPLGPIDPREAPDQPGSPLAPPFPDIAIASGRRAVAYLRRLKREAGRATLNVFLKDPRIGAKAADLIWVPAHDRLRGDNVLVSLTSPHRISPERLSAAKAAPEPWGEGDGRPRLGVLLGGNSRHHKFTSEDTARFIGMLGGLVSAGLRPLITPSRRTPTELAEAAKALVAAADGYFWDGTGENPYISLLAHADHLVVTADSVNMLGEAAATGTPIQLFEPKGGHTKISAFVKGLMDHGAVRLLDGRLETWRYPPLDATPEIAIAVAEAYRKLRNG